MSAPAPKPAPPTPVQRGLTTEQEARLRVLSTVLSHNRDADAALDLANWVMNGEDGE